MTDRVLFLDIDGVLLPGRAYHLPTQTKPIVTVFDPCAVSLLNNICFKYSGALRYRVVVHSSWIRTGFWSNEDITVKEHCVRQGVREAAFHSDWSCNPDLSWRYDRIDEWLGRHPDVKEFVILDDEPLDDRHLSYVDNFFQTDFDEGLSMSIFNKIANQNYKEMIRLRMAK